jgi:hypothetical protein
MPRPKDEGGTLYTVTPSGQIVVAPPPAPAGVTQAQIDASLAANPQASKGGYEGVGTPATPGPAGTTSYVDPSQPTPATVTTQAGTTVSTSTGATVGTALADPGAFLGLYGLPSDVASKVNEIFVKNPDVGTATQLAMAYIRGTPWYAQTYPGIQEGIARGVIGNEADYRKYLNDINNLTQQYQGRHVGSDELVGYLGQGYTTTHVGQLYAGTAWANANKADVQYTTGAFDTGQLSPAELAALGNENAGLDSELGQRLQNRLNLAQQRLRGVFSGSLATPGLSTANGRLQATSLGGKTSPDVGA